MQGFDGSRAAPSLVKALESGELSVKGKRVLVPGCGYPPHIHLAFRKFAHPSPVSHAAHCILSGIIAADVDTMLSSWQGTEHLLLWGWSCPKMQ